MTHEFWMKKALIEAEKARERDEVPVGAVIVGADNLLISAAFNLKESCSDPCGHAEVLAIRKASEKLSSWRLTDCTLYVTLEPCMMCTGALIQSRVKHIVYGASDPKGGFVESIEKGFSYKELNHQVTWTKGVLAPECSKILSDFFKEKRARK